MKLSFIVITVTELEINKGLVANPSSKLMNFCYLRDISNIDTGLSALKYSRKYMDFIKVTVDNEAAQMMQILRDKKIMLYIPASNIAHYKIDWKYPKGVDNNFHSDYLCELAERFYSDISNAVTMAAASSYILPSLHDEILHHLQTCKSLCARFHGMQVLLEKICSYLLHDTSLKPLILVGQSGSGKSSIIAKAFEKV